VDRRDDARQAADHRGHLHQPAREDGERVPGAISMADLEKRFAEAKAAAAK